MKQKILLLVVFCLCLVLLNGCAVIFQSGRRSDAEKIRALEKELDEFRGAKEALEAKLSQEIGDRRVSLRMDEKGLVITFVAEVLFDSGKAVLKEGAFDVLDKVAGILNKEALNNNIGIEGHTDNQPIKHSGWKSNWELSSHRALSVLYYLENKGVASQRLSASGYGEHRPVASNDSSEGRQLNRRVEIVILPQIAKAADLSKEAEAEEELK